jgi:anti-sigma B factor antagonist
MQVQLLGEVTVVKLPARVDAITAGEVEATFSEQIAGGARKLVADFASTEYISSAGLRIFLATLKVLGKHDGRIVLCAMAPFIAEVFDISGFCDLFEIVGTLDEAVAALS